VLSVSCSKAQVPASVEASKINSAALLDHVRTLSSDEYEGRLSGSIGAQKARDYIVESLKENGVASCGTKYVHEFSIEGRVTEWPLANVLGRVAGSAPDAKTIVVSAHFDHLGNRNGSIYNGADDNASGTAALLELAAWFQHHPIENDLVFAAFDAEEIGLQGARAFVTAPCVDGGEIILNIDMDMISRSESSELYASGTHYYPALAPILERAAAEAPFSLRLGHDEPGTGRENWTQSSDHGPFFNANIPHIYFGVEDHPGYHNPTDNYEDITEGFFVDVVEFIAAAIVELDEESATIKNLTKQQ
jgi:Zn-dependent M28 family amino/carboxypeptidase